MNPAYEMLASRRILVVDKAEFDAMYMRAFPAQRTLEITLPIPAVFKDGVFYIPDGSLAIKYPNATRGKIIAYDSTIGPPTSAPKSESRITVSLRCDGNIVAMTGSNPPGLTGQYDPREQVFHLFDSPDHQVAEFPLEPNFRFMTIEIAIPEQEKEIV